MLPGSVWIKYLWRVVHVGSLVVICQGIISNKLAGQLTTSSHPILYLVAGVLAMLSGIVNTFLLKPKTMGVRRKPWMGYHHLKTLTAVLILTPIHKVLPLDVAAKINLQFYWMVAALLASPLARFYREHHTALEQQSLKADDEERARLSSERRRQ